MVKCEVFSSPISILFSSLLLMLFPLVRSGDAESLLALRASFDPLNVLQWGLVTNVCQWQGVKECRDGRIIKLVVEGFNLSGTLDGPSLNQLDQLRILSFKENSLSGQIPEIFGLVNLKSLYLNNNRFSGEIPVSLSSLNRLKTVVLSGNRISGQIPHSLVDLRRLYVLYLQDNQLNGSIPPFSQNSLRFFNVSNNALSGEIPLSLRFNESSFSGNMDLCGEQIQRPCSFGPFASPSYPILPSRNVKHHKKLILIVVLSVGGFFLLCIAGVLLRMCCLRKTSRETETRSKTFARTGEEGPTSTGGGEGGFSWDQDGEGLGSLTFLGPEDQHMSYSLEDLLKASAETLGRGIIGSTYKAVMESGYIVTVKRLKDSSYPRIEEFRRHAEILGQLRHPNLVPLRAYFQAKEERLLVYDYFPNGSLFSLVHGSRASGGSKPLHWTSCLKIADDIATGLLYIHQNPGLTHGNLKSTNVLLGPDFESCLTDYGLTPFENPNAMNESSSSNSLFFRAPECRDVQKPLTQPADVYSYGVLILELLTGKNPFQDLVQEHGSDIVRWVQTVRAEETESGSSNEASEEKLGVLVNVAMACVSIEPESRPIMMNVLRMIREVRVEVQVQVSSNSSGHSPGRWSGSVHGLPREEQLSI